MTYPNIFPALPEVFLAFMIVVILFVEAFCSKKKYSYGTNLINLGWLFYNANIC